MRRNTMTTTANFKLAKIEDFYDPKLHTPEQYILHHKILKPMQIAIVNCSYLHGYDILVNLPTGFGKSMIFQYIASQLK